MRGIAAETSEQREAATPQIGGTLFVADTKNTRTRTRARHRFGKSAHALKQAARVARDAADQETDFHVVKWRRPPGIGNTVHQNL